MITRKFASLAHMAEFLEGQTAMMVPTGQLAIAATQDVLLRNVKAMYGNEHLAELAEATQADREAKGYTANDPLLRDGALLRDSLEVDRGPNYVAVGSSEPVAMYHEYGYINARTGKPVPPRAAFREGLRNATPEAIEIAQEITGVNLGVAPLSARLTEISVIK